MKKVQALSPLEEELLATITDSRSEMLSLLQALVEINSHSQNPEGSKAVLEILKGEFQAIGFTAEEFSPEGSAHRHMLFSPPNPKRHALLCGHVDTVYPKDSDFNSFQCNGERAVGPGVLDMKGGLVVMLFALKALYRHRPDVLESVSAFLNSDEEIGSPSSSEILTKLARGFKAGLVFEFGRPKDRIILERKGSGSLSFKVHGVAAHSGNDHPKGRSAILELAHKIIAIEKLTNYKKGITLNVGIARGGESKNTVPSSAEAVVDMRFIQEKDGLETFKRIQKIFSKRDVMNTKIELVSFKLRPAMIETKESHALAQSYGEAARTVGLGFGLCPVMGGASDAAFFSKADVPVVDGLGPRGDGAHAAHKEYIEIQSLVPKAQALAVWLVRASN